MLLDLHHLCYLIVIRTHSIEAKLNIVLATEHLDILIIHKVHYYCAKYHI